MTSSLSYVLGPQNGEPCALQITAQSNNRVLVEVSNSDAQITLSVSVDIEALRRVIGYVGEEIHDEQMLRDTLVPGGMAKSMLAVNQSVRT